MSQAYICTVSPKLPENYQIGLLAGRWGVEKKYRHLIAPVRPGDLLIFVVAGCFRSIHRVTRDMYEDPTPLWPAKGGDPFPYRIAIGPAEVSGTVSIREFAPRISFMWGKVWGGTLMGANGVFNPRATSQDVDLIRTALLASRHVGDNMVASDDVAPNSVIPFSSDYWCPGLLDQLAALASLQKTGRFLDPYRGVPEWQQGLLTGIFTDQRQTPTVAIAAIDRTPSEIVLSTLFGLSAVKQSSDAKAVRGVIFVQKERDEIKRLTAGVPNLATYGFDVKVSLHA